MVGAAPRLQCGCHTCVRGCIRALWTGCLPSLRPWVGGISGGKHGAYSVALSGGYDDDVDLGYAL